MPLKGAWLESFEADAAAADEAAKRLQARLNKMIAQLPREHRQRVRPRFRARMRQRPCLRTCYIRTRGTSVRVLRHRHVFVRCRLGLAAS